MPRSPKDRTPAERTAEAHRHLEKAVTLTQKAYDGYVDVGTLSDAERAHALQLVGRYKERLTALQELIG